MAGLLLTGSAVCAVPTSAWMNIVRNSLSSRRNSTILLIIPGTREGDPVAGGAFGAPIYDPGADH
jgi:hypothetical protein